MLVDVRSICLGIYEEANIHALQIWVFRLTLSLSRPERSGGRLEALVMHDLSTD
jgi:hypothetical protein